jgi:hypothetical protein
MTRNLSVTDRIRPTWRALVAVGLVISYLALTGEAIHCQFVPTNHHAHQGKTSKQVNHANHCLLANQSSATMTTAVVVAIPVLFPIGLHGESPHYRDTPSPFALLPARAPPNA